MHGVLQVGLTNAVLATLLAVVVWCVTRIVRRPAVAHVLWLLVLVKLVTPPFFSLPLPFLRAPAPAEPERPGPVTRHRDPAGPRFDVVTDDRQEPVGVVDAPPAEGPATLVESARPFSWVWVIAGCWAAGSPSPRSSSAPS